MKYVTINNATIILGITPPPRQNCGRPASERAERPIGAATLKAGKPA